MVKGTKHTEESKHKMSEKMKGRTLSEESRKKIGEGVARWYAENANSDTELNRRAKLSAIGKRRMEVWKQYLEKENNL